MSEYLPEGRLSADPSNLHKMSSPKLLHEAAQTGDVLEARAVMCDAAHNLTVDLGCMRGVIPREDGALGIRDGSVRDIARRTFAGECPEKMYGELYLVTQKR